MKNSFTNARLLWVAFLVFTVMTVLRQQATSTQELSSLKIQKLEINRINWDKLEIIPDYTLDVVSADFGVTSKIIEEITVFDTNGKAIYETANDHSISLPDAELGSNESITIQYCLIKAKEKVCEETKIKASPKRLSIDPEITYPFNNRIFLGNFNLNGKISRQVFGQDEQFELVETTMGGIEASLKLRPKGSDVSVTVPVKGNSGKFDLSQVEFYQEFKQQIQQLIYDEKITFDYEVIATLGQAYASYPEGLVADVETVELEEETIEEEVVVEPVAEEEVEEVVEVEEAVIEEPAEVVPEVIEEETPEAAEIEEELPVDLHVPFEAKFDLFEKLPAPSIDPYEVAVVEEKEEEKKEEVKEKKKKEIAKVVKPKEKPIAIAPKPKKKTAKPKKAAPKECFNYDALVNQFAKRVQFPVIRMVHEDPIISTNSNISSYRYNKDTGKFTINMTVKWVDRWLEETYSVDGVLSVNKDGREARFKMTSKNQNVVDLEEFTAQKSKGAIYMKSL